MVGRPTTQNIIGKAKMVQCKELGEGNARIQHAKLYLSSLTDNETSAPPSSTNSDLLRFDASISTSNNTIRSAYSLFDCGASHGYVNTAYANSLGLKHRLCRRMRVSVAGEEKVEEDRWQVWLKVSVGVVTGNRVNISGWYTIFDLGGIYDLIVGKDWMASNLHIIDHKTNTLHMLEPDWTDLQQCSRLPSTIVTTSLVGLRPHQGQLREVRAHCKLVARRSAINLVSTFIVTKCKSSEMLNVTIRECIDKIMEEEEETTPHKPADLETWRLRIRQAFADIFEPPTGVPPASKHDLRIDTNSTAMPPHRQPYQMSD